MNDALNRLKAEVTENNSLVASAITLIGGLATQIRDNLNDEQALSELADSLDSSGNELAAALTANTPASDVGGGEPAPAPVDPVVGGEPATDPAPPVLDNGGEPVDGDLPQ